MKTSKKLLALLLATVMMVGTFAACGKKAPTAPTASPAASPATDKADDATTLVYGSGDYTRINPAIDEH
ncbi:MAG: ABC transporter substrate-binding protein, partial [Oscillospiraceae bacterium]